MEHPYLFLVKIFEIIGLGHFAHSYPWVIYSWFVMILLILLGALATKGVSMIPGKGQNFFEIVVSGIEEFMVGVTGEEGRYLFPLIGTLAFFILLSNYMGMIPGFFGPTANVNTTLACAIIVVFYTHVVGVKFHGPAYIKHFMGPIWWLAPLIFVVEVIGHFARILSLSIRLFGNIMGEELVLAILMFLAGAYLAPLPMMFLGLFTGGVQAFIFCLLSMMYFAGAIEHAH